MPRSEAPLPNREQIAQAEVGRTDVSRGVARLLIAAFLVTVFTVPLVQAVLDARAGKLAKGSGPRSVFEAFDTQAVRDAFAERGVFAANQVVRRQLQGFEKSLENDSVVAVTARPAAQWVFTGLFNVGNERSYCGRDGWLYYRPGIDHLTGPGFLDTRPFHRPAEDGFAPPPPRAADPVAAILDLDRQLAARGIDLIVVPVPGKASIHPEWFSARFQAGSAPVENASHDEFLRRLKDGGVAVLDVASLLVSEARPDRPAFLRTDSHWRPEAMDRVARALADLVRERTPLPPVDPPGYRREPVPVSGPGDLALLLRLPRLLPLYRPEAATIQQVSGPGGEAWRPDKDADVLVLGDSFTNVYSVPVLGFGASAGLAEQLAWHLGRPVDRVAVNDGGAYRSREDLARALARGEDRLAGKRTVIYEFAARELSFGDWKRIDLGPVRKPVKPGEPVARGTPPPAEPDGRPRRISGLVRAVAPVPAAGTTPYRDCIVAVRMQTADLGAQARDVLVYVWGLRDGKEAETARLRPRERVTLRVVPWSAVESRYGTYQRMELPEDDALLLDPYWAVGGEERL